MLYTTTNSDPSLRYNLSTIEETSTEEKDEEAIDEHVRHKFSTISQASGSYRLQNSPTPSAYKLSWASSTRKESTQSNSSSISSGFSYSKPIVDCRRESLLSKADLTRRRLSFRTTALALARFRRRIVVFDKADMCLCGLLNLSLSVHLICCIEVFFSMVLLIQSPDLITMDGTYFYFLGMLEGCGEYFFALHFLMSVSCVLTALLLYVGSRSRRPAYVLPHYLWQISFIVMTIILSTVLLNLGLSGKMLLPSSIVLSCMLLVPGIAEIWWSYLTLCYYRQLLSKSSVYKRPKAPIVAPFKATEC
ncbi:unnamed protein product [Auanema sp. JU1783]|nr:unnamed protein product [Auanema sp. JU1783]